MIGFFFFFGCIFTAQAFKQQTERLVNELKISAPLSEYKLKIIEGKTESLLQNSSEIYNSLSSIDTRIQLVAQTTKNVGDHIDFILKHSEALYQQSKKLAASQSELQ